MKRLTLILSLLGLALFAACTPTPTPALPTQFPTPTVMVATVHVVTPTAPAATNTPPPQGGLDGEQFDLDLAEALEAKDFAALRDMMGDSFAFATLNTNLNVIPADQAIQQLQAGPLAGSAAPKANFTTSAADLLGTDPLAQWGPVFAPIRALHVTGLNDNQAGEAVVVIGRNEASGELYWHGILLPLGTTFASPVPDPAEVAVTDVQQVSAKTDLVVRLGPGEQYEQVGGLRGGEIAQVTGRSLDGAWWRIYCTNVASGLCWISADPALTEPAQ